jgi:4-aminobutyrate aminotransferase
MNAGIAVAATGHCHPELVAALQEQAGKLIHMAGTDFFIGKPVDLAEKLSEIVPGPRPKRSFMGNSGTEAVEGALKLAKYKTGRHNIITFFGGFHGRTMGALSANGSKATHRKKYSPYLAGVYHVPFPDPYRNPFSEEWGSPTDASLRYLKEYIFDKLVYPDEVAAVIVEPIQGEGGYIVPPDDFFGKLRKICDDHGIMLIVDEVQSGFGRTGKMFAIEHWGVAPDIMTIAKGIASGVPLGIFIAPQEIMDWPPGVHGNTYGGNLLACTAALKTIELLEGGLIENSAKVGKQILDRISDWPTKYKYVGHVRGKGLMIGIEFVKDKKTKEWAPEIADAVAEKGFQKGILLLPAGKSVVRLSPPLVISQKQADCAIDILEEVVKTL